MKISKLNKPWQYLIGLMVFLTILSGVVLRALYITPIGKLNFTHLMHAHSHLAILGWIYPAIMALILAVVLNGRPFPKGATVIFVITQIINFFMFIAFVIQGYALFSIIFSSLHIILSYIFIYYFFREIKRNQIDLRKSTAGLFIKGSIFFLLTGSLGPWILAYWNAASLDKDFVYDLLVHTFLHFQINGWITLSIIGILLFLLEKEKALKHSRLIEFGFWLYSLSLLPSMILNVDWTEASLALLPVAVIGWAMKIAGIGMTLLGVMKSGALRRSFSGWARTFLTVGLFSLLVKTAVEVGNTIPALIPFSMNTRNIVIGYLHIGLIGFASFTLIALFIKVKWLDRTQSLAFNTVIISFVLYEALLFGDGLLSSLLKKPLPYINIWLFIVSIILSIGALSLFMKKKKAPMME